MYIVHAWPSARESRFLYARLALFAVEWRQGDLQTERMRETKQIMAFHKILYAQLLADEW